MTTYAADAYYLDRQLLEIQTVKELAQTLTNAGIAGRSKAKTKAEKVDLLLTAYFGYSIDSEGNISQNIAPVAPAPEETAKPAKKAKKEPTRREIDKIAQEIGWTVVIEGDIFALKHDRARPGENMATARTLPAIARKLAKIKDEYFAALADCRASAFYNKYYWKKSKGNFQKAS